MNIHSKKINLERAIIGMNIDGEYIKLINGEKMMMAVFTLSSVF